MSSTKNVLIYAVTAKNETSYGVSGSALSLTTDGVEVTTLPTFTLEYAYDGKRQPAAGAFGQIRRNVTSGRNSKGQLSIDLKGLGSAYSLTATPPNVHALLLASGLSGSFSASAWYYTPDAVTNSPKSVVMDVYPRQERWALTAGYASFQIDATGGGGGKVLFDVQALASAPVDASPPAITYVSSSVFPPVAAQIGLNIGAYTGAKVRSLKFDQKRALQARVDINSVAGHAGFNPGERQPVFSVTIEAEAQSTFNPYTLREAGTLTAVTFTLGTVANNKVGMSFPQAQLMTVKEGADGSVATWDLEFQPAMTSPTANDDFVLFYQ